MNDNDNEKEKSNIINIDDFLPPLDITFSPDFDENMEVYIDRPWWLDNYDMHDKFGFHDAIGKMTPEMLREMLKFRLNFLQEELDEAKNAESGEDIVDAMIDLCVVAIGTLDCFDVDAQEAWNRVHNANMAKERGIKPNRPNPLGLPDLCKPEGWTAPDHSDNHGILDRIDFKDFGKLFK
jgi:predicted HAD superfamily Cof-like phosphohydrolase